MEESALTVSALNEYVRRSLAADPMLRSIRLRGEISNFKQHFSGHWYFSVKDEFARIACVMFRQNNLAVSFVPFDGMRVVLEGSVGLYTASGSYQFYAEGIKKDGTGELYERFLRLKEQLTKEGLFDLSRKKPLPLLPNAVGIITSRTGAVLHDIVTVSHRRCSFVPLLLRAAQVQGDAAADDLVNALHEMATQTDVDVIIIGRGGGSMEDLWAFNEEKVVRAIAACPVPIISAVGHETDITLSDFAADVRAATPSQAAELAVPDRNLLCENLRRTSLSMSTAVGCSLLARRNKLNEMHKRLDQRAPLLLTANLRRKIELLDLRMQTAIGRGIDTRRNALRTLQTQLETLGPYATMRRGYALVTDGTKIISSVRDVADKMTICFKDGKIDVARNGRKSDDKKERKL